MHRQNRVTPLGDIISDASRGALMGNRGSLHSPDGVITSKWKHKHWITCALEFKGRKRALMSPGRYTELFFCDEATALAAGHRPCWECRRADAVRFSQAWRRAYGLAKVTAAQMDDALHVARITGDGQQVRFASPLGSLPDGTMVLLEDQPNAAWLIWLHRLYRWSPDGYLESRSVSDGTNVLVCTPEPTVGVLTAGYLPQVHPSVIQ